MSVRVHVWMLYVRVSVSLYVPMYLCMWVSAKTNIVDLTKPSIPTFKG